MIATIDKFERKMIDWKRCIEVLRTIQERWSSRVDRLCFAEWACDSTHNTGRFVYANTLDIPFAKRDN